MKKNTILACTALSLILPCVPAHAANDIYNISPASTPQQIKDSTSSQVMTIHDRERSSDLTTIWIAPRKDCNDKADGSKDNPVCDVSQASSILNNLYQQGKARGDVDIRFKTGKGVVYQPENGKRFGDFTFTPTAGHVVRFIPDWYNNIDDLKKINADNRINVKGYPASQSKNNDSGIGLSISPKSNKGGTYQISGFHFDNLVNPLKVITPQVTKDKISNSSDPEDIYKNIRHSQNAPIGNMLISNNVFDHVGDAYTAGGGNYISGAMRVWGATNMLIKDNTFINGKATSKNTSTSHVIYNYMTSGTVYEGNTFKNNNYSLIRARLSNDDIITGNNFSTSKSLFGKDKEVIGTWYQGYLYGKGGTRDNKSYAECKGDGPFEFNNTFTGRHSTVLRNLRQQPYCTDTKRITAPMFLEGIQTGDKEYSLRWGDADTNGDGVKNYHVYVGKANKYGTPTSDVPVKVKTTPSSVHEATIDKSMFDKAGIKPGDNFHYYVVAESTSGWLSSRNQLKTSAFLDKTYQGRDNYNVARVESWDRIIDGKKPEKSTFNYELVSHKVSPSYKSAKVKPGDKATQSVPLSKVPAYTTFSLKDSTFPKKVSIDPRTGKITADTARVKPGKYTIDVDVQYGDWSHDTATFNLEVEEETVDKPSTDKPTTSTSKKPTTSTSKKPTTSTSKKPTTSTSKKPTTSTSEKPTTSTSEKPTSTDKPTTSTSSDTSKPSSSNDVTTSKKPTTTPSNKKTASSTVVSPAAQPSPVDKGRSHHPSLWEKIKSVFSPHKEDQSSSNNQVETPYHAVDAENSENSTGDSYDYHPGDASNDADTGEGKVGPEVNTGGRVDVSFLDKVISIVK